MFCTILASTQEKLSSGCPTKQFSNQSPQLQRLARKLKFSPVASLDIILSQNVNKKDADQSAQAGLPLCFSQPHKDRFSRDEAHLMLSFIGLTKTSRSL